MSSEEVMDRDVPFSRKLEPVGTVPPVAIEMSVGETGDFGEGSKYILKDDKEYEKEGDHEWSKE